MALTLSQVLTYISTDLIAYYTCRTIVQKDTNIGYGNKQKKEEYEWHGHFVSKTAPAYYGTKPAKM